MTKPGLEKDVAHTTQLQKAASKLVDSHKFQVQQLLNFAFFSFYYIIFIIYHILPFNPNNPCLVLVGLFLLVCDTSQGVTKLDLYGCKSMLQSALTKLQAGDAVAPDTVAELLRCLDLAGTLS